MRLRNLCEMLARSWVLRRNCALTPRQLGLAFALICVMSTLVACGFALLGYWLVPGFAALEMTAVGAAFLLYARHASDREQIFLDGEELLVELVECERITQHRMDPRRTRVEPPCMNRTLIGLDAGSVRLEVGRFLCPADRRGLAQELRLALESNKTDGIPI